LAVDGPRIDLSSEVRPHLVVCLRVVQIIQVKVLCRPTSTQVIQGSTCLSIDPKDNNRRMTIEHDLCARSRARFVLWPYPLVEHPDLLFIDIQKLFGCLGLDGANQVKLGPLRSSSAVNTKFVW
jgi:hypothetical protein